MLLAWLATLVIAFLLGWGFGARRPLDEYNRGWDECLDGKSVV